MKLPKYQNADTCKATVLSENKNKSGIYIWKNKINGKRYIGSAVDLSKRLKFYYSNSSMESLLKISKSHICSALLKHGRSNFSLEILEYCSPEKCVEREKYYIDLLGSEYNIVKDPTLPSMSGRKHSEETIKIMEDRTHSDDTKKKISDTMTGENNPMYGKNHTKETKTIMSDAKKGKNHPNYGKPRYEGSGSPSQIFKQ